MASVEGLITALTQTMAAQARPMFDQRCLGELDCFSGNDQDWPACSLSFRSYAGGIDEGADAARMAAELDGTELALGSLNEAARNFSNELYMLLLPCLKGRALSVCHHFEWGNSLVLWRALHRKCEPALA